MAKSWSLAVVVVLGACNSQPPDAAIPQSVVSVESSSCAMDCSAWGHTLTIHSGSNVPYGTCVSGQCGTSIVTYGARSCNDECKYLISPSLICLNARATLVDENSGQSFLYPITCDLAPALVADADDGHPGTPAPWPYDFDYAANGQWCFCGPG